MFLINIDIFEVIMITKNLTSIMIILKKRELMVVKDTIK